MIYFILFFLREYMIFYYLQGIKYYLLIGSGYLLEFEYLQYLLYWVVYIMYCEDHVSSLLSFRYIRCLVSPIVFFCRVYIFWKYRGTLSLGGLIPYISLELESLSFIIVLFRSSNTPKRSIYSLLC